jgi:3-dehydroquinate dehydratase-2
VEIYGATSLAALDEAIVKRAEELGMEVRIAQSNHEGQLIDWIQEHRDWAQGLILNPGGYTHTSVALRDAVAGVRIPCIEVHVSNIYAREEFRRTSLLSPVCVGVISGLGASGYLLALEGMKWILEAEL